MKTLFVRMQHLRGLMLLTLGLPLLAHAWGEADTVQVCNRNDVSITVAYGAWSPDLPESSRSWRRGGWWTIEPRECRAVVDLEDYSGDVGVMLAVMADGVPTWPSRSYTGGAKQCVTDKPFTLRGGSTQGATSCPAGQHLEAFPYWELIRWSEWSDVTLGARRPKIDVVIAKYMKREVDPGQLQAQARLPERPRDMGPHFACTIERVKREFQKGAASRVVSVENKDCTKEIDSLCVSFRLPKSQRFEDGFYIYERSTDKWAEVTAINPGKGRVKKVLEWPVEGRADIDAVEAISSGYCRWVE
jgi:uncharacterized membrane protein